MDSRTTIEGLWRAARDGVARLNALLREGDLPEDAIFSAPKPAPRQAEAERRLAAARRERTRDA